MIFWRKKNNISQQEAEKEEDELLHPQGEPAIEPSIEEQDAQKSDHHIETEEEVIEELEASPVPAHTEIDDIIEREELADHSAEGGWLSRLSQGLSKTTVKITRGLSDALTKTKLDQDTLDSLEDILIEADLGPKTAAKVIEDFSKGRFGKDIDEQEIKEALAQSIETILLPVAKPLDVTCKDGPFVILVCGVNGAGKTTTIGKYAAQLYKEQGKKIMIAAGDTFRAAAVEQLGVWAKRANAEIFQKDIGADSAAVAFEAYQKAKAEGADVLMIDTAGRLQNKANLMAELEKIIRVLKKSNESVPHATLLVLDATTGQNAFSQLETFQKMVHVTGLIVTKLDGSAKGGVLIGLADQYGVPVHAIGVGEGIEDLKPFTAKGYARTLMGIED